MKLKCFSVISSENGNYDGNYSIQSNSNSSCHYHKCTIQGYNLHVTKYYKNTVHTHKFTKSLILVGRKMIKNLSLTKKKKKKEKKKRKKKKGEWHLILQCWSKQKDRFVCLEQCQNQYNKPSDKVISICQRKLQYLNNNRVTLSGDIKNN